MMEPMCVGLKVDIASILPTGIHLNLKRKIFNAKKTDVVFHSHCGENCMEIN